jgi:hypothetical protein
MGAVCRRTYNDELKSVVLSISYFVDVFCHRTKLADLGILTV